MKSKMLISMVTLLVLSALLGGGGWQRAAAEDLLAWIPATPLSVPMAMGLVRCSNMPDSFYLVTGIRDVNVTTDLFLHYDISTGVWTQLANLPKPVRLAAIACYEGKIYAAGGFRSTQIRSFYIYDIATDAWMRGPNLPDDVMGASLGAWRGKLYLVGGSRDYFWNPVSRVDVYDIASGKWTAGGGQEMPAAVFMPFKVQVGPYIYVVGGMSNVEPYNVDLTQRYDMRKNKWEIGPAFTSARAGGSLAATSSHLYALGGDLDGGWAMDTTDLVEVLDLSTWPEGAWEDAGVSLIIPSLNPATTCSETVTGGEIWNVGGVNADFQSLDEVYYLPIDEGCP